MADNSTKIYNWDFDELDRVVTGVLGKAPELSLKEQIDFLKKDNVENAKALKYYTNYDKDSVLMDIGSGLGFMANYLSSQVKKVYCCDISQSCLDLAKKNCEGLDNISFHKISRSANRFHFAENAKIDLIYSFALFIHLNLYDIYWYLVDYHTILNKNGLVFFDYFNADTITTNSNHLFLEHSGYYRDDTSCLSHLLSWNSPKAIRDLVNSLNYSMVHEVFDDDGTVSVVIKKN